MLFKLKNQLMSPEDTSAGTTRDPKEFKPLSKSKPYYRGNPLVTEQILHMFKPIETPIEVLDRYGRIKETVTINPLTSRVEVTGYYLLTNENIFKYNKGFRAWRLNDPAREWFKEHFGRTYQDKLLGLEVKYLSNPGPEDEFYDVYKDSPEKGAVGVVRFPFTIDPRYMKDIVFEESPSIPVTTSIFRASDDTFLDELKTIEKSITDPTLDKGLIVSGSLRLAISSIERLTGYVQNVNAFMNNLLSIRTPDTDNGKQKILHLLALIPNIRRINTKEYLLQFPVNISKEFIEEVVYKREDFWRSTVNVGRIDIPDDQLLLFNSGYGSNFLFTTLYPFIYYRGKNNISYSDIMPLSTIGSFSSGPVLGNTVKSTLERHSSDIQGFGKPSIIASRLSGVYNGSLTTIRSYRYTFTIKDIDAKVFYHGLINEQYWNGENVLPLDEITSSKMLEENRLFNYRIVREGDSLGLNEICNTIGVNTNAHIVTGRSNNTLRSSTDDGRTTSNNVFVIGDDNTRLFNLMLGYYGFNYYRNDPRMKYLLLPLIYYNDNLYYYKEKYQAVRFKDIFADGEKLTLQSLENMGKAAAEEDTRNGFPVNDFFIGSSSVPTPLQISKTKNIEIILEDDRRVNFYAYMVKQGLVPDNPFIDGLSLSHVGEDGIMMQYLSVDAYKEIHGDEVVYWWQMDWSGYPS